MDKDIDKLLAKLQKPHWLVSAHLKKDSSQRLHMYMDDFLKEAIKYYANEMNTNMTTAVRMLLKDALIKHYRKDRIFYRTSIDK